MQNLKRFFQKNYMLLIEIIMPYLIFFVPIISKNYIDEEVTFVYNFYETFTQNEYLLFAIGSYIAIFVTIGFFAILIISNVLPLVYIKHNKIFKIIKAILSGIFCISSILLLISTIFIKGRIVGGINNANKLLAGVIVLPFYCFVMLAFDIKFCKRKS